MNLQRADNSNQTEQLANHFRDEIDNTSGADRLFAYTSWVMLKDGFYSPDELIDLSIQGGFVLDNPFTKIRRGTKIAKNVVIKNGTSIDGNDISIGFGTILDNARVIGSNISIGENNYISGKITVNNASLGNSNEVYGIQGQNNGELIIGNANQIFDIVITNPQAGVIRIGHHNELHKGLSVNCLFCKGNIYIGDHNSLGRDGGGVISTSYRFSHGWWGDVLIGSNVETTRGAEILGFSVIGWPLTKKEDEEAKELFQNGSISGVESFIQRILNHDSGDECDSKQISLYGVVKTKLCCLTGKVTLKDDTRIQRSYVRNFIIQERSKIYFCAINPEQDKTIKVTFQDRALERLTITQHIDWLHLPIEAQTDGYVDEDAQFYA